MKRLIWKLDAVILDQDRAARSSGNAILIVSNRTARRRHHRAMLLCLFVCHFFLQVCAFGLSDSEWRGESDSSNRRHIPPTLVHF